MPHCELHYDLCWVSWEPHSVSPLQGKDMGTMLQDSRNHYVGFHRRTSNNSRASFSSGYVKEIGRFTRHVALVLYSPLLLGWQLESVGPRVVAGHTLRWRSVQISTTNPHYYTALQNATVQWVPFTTICTVQRSVFVLWMTTVSVRKGFQSQNKSCKRLLNISTLLSLHKLLTFADFLAWDTDTRLVQNSEFWLLGLFFIQLRNCEWNQIHFHCNYASC